MENNRCPRIMYAYQSANLKDDEIIESFVVRKKEFARIISEIKRDDMSKAIQHFILVGRRGSGKSTLLRRIEAEVNRDQKLSKKLIVVNLSEEQAGIYRLHDLWDLILRTFNSRNIPTEKVEWALFSNNQNEYSKKLYSLIQQSLNQQKKKLLLLLDNIDRIFENIGEDAHLLRELLTNHKDLRIIGGSVKMSEHYWKYDKPFYEYFRIIRLESLSREEVGELLSYWSSCMHLPDLETFLKKNPGKIETIRILTDGMPRTLLNFLEILIDREDQNGYEYLRLILDRVTPVYQERLNYLPPAQRKVIIELANFWDAVKVNQLIEVCKMPGKVISAQLSQLEKSEIVEKIPGFKREHLYRLSERFFNLWLLMTQGGPKEKRQVKYLTVFLENWYDEPELRSLFNQHISGLEAESLKPDYAVLMSSALAHLRNITADQRDILIEKTRYLKEAELKYGEYIPASTAEIIDNVMQNLISHDYKSARMELNSIEQAHPLKEGIYGLISMMEGDYPKAEKELLNAINQKDATAEFYLAYLYNKTNRLDEAEKYYLLANEKGIEEASFNLANIYRKNRRFEDAERYYLIAISNGIDDALYNLALLYTLSNRMEEAEKYYLLAHKKGFVKATFNLAKLYFDLNQLENAEKFYLMAIQKGDIDSLFNIAELYRIKGRLDEAEKYYLLAIKNGNIEALNNLANLYAILHRFDDAEKYYLQSLNKGHLQALYNLAILYKEENRQDDAEKYYLLAIDNGDDRALNNLAALYQEKDQFDLAEQYYKAAIDKGINQSLVNLLKLYYSRNMNKQKVVNLVKEKIAHKVGHESMIIFSIVFLWAGQMKEFEETAKVLIPDILQKEGTDDLMDLFFAFLVHKQYNYVWSWFNNREFGDKLREMVKPLYYLTAEFIKGQEEEALRPGPEIEESIKEIREELVKQQAFYYE